MDPIILTSVNDLIGWNLKNTQGERKRFVYRGVTNLEYKLIPKIARGDNNGVVEGETAMSRLRKLQEYLEVYLPAYGFEFSGIPLPERHWKQLFIAQHYGAPTNLLDFTRNPLVAAFFSAKDSTTDGMIYAFQIREQNADKKVFNIAGFDNRRLKELSPFTNHPDLEYLFIVPPHTDRRIIAQVSIFSFFRGIDLTTSLDSRRELSYEDLDFYTGAYKFIVPKEKKTTMMDELNKIGVNESSLFPDLHGFGEFLKWKLFTKYK